MAQRLASKVSRLAAGRVGRCRRLSRCGKFDFYGHRLIFEARPMDFSYAAVSTADFFLTMKKVCAHEDKGLRS